MGERLEARVHKDRIMGRFMTEDNVGDYFNGDSGDDRK